MIISNTFKPFSVLNGRMDSYIINNINDNKTLNTETKEFINTNQLFNYNDYMNLTSLTINYTNLEEIIDLLPTNLEELNISSNSLKKLPHLPNKLKFLYCSYNYITHIDEMPESIQFLDCSNNNITYINISKGLHHLLCNNNKITKINSFPDELYSVQCFNNLLSELPDLNNVTYLDCHNNLLIKLPIKSNINDKLTYMDIQNNKIKYIPSYYLYYLVKVIYIKINNNPIASVIKNDFCNDLKLYLILQMENDRKNIKKIEDWFLKCKYNPKYKYCKQWLLKGYYELYGY
jgi:Leucine-rich repeat (LRR) protein